jgi:phosphoribosylformylglycinamidine synthase
VPLKLLKYGIVRAGIYSESFNVPCLMPYPENLIDPLVGETDGRGLFESVTAIAKAA